MSADAVLLQEPQSFQMRKCLEAVYVAKNEVVNGCSGANMGASWRTYLWGCSAVRLFDTSVVLCGKAHDRFG